MMSCCCNSVCCSIWGERHLRQQPDRAAGSAACSKAASDALQGPGTVRLDSIDDADAGAQSEAAAGKYFRWLAGTAAAAGVSVDVFAVGNSAANVAALAPMAERSGGLLVLQEGGPAQGSHLSPS